MRQVVAEYLSLMQRDLVDVYQLRRSRARAERFFPIASLASSSCWPSPGP